MSPGLCVEALALTLGAFRLRKIDFAVSDGEILVVLGRNGSGKSVTLETIAGFHRPDCGRVLIDGRDVTALPPERRNVGFVVQNFGLFPHLSVAQNVAIARRRDRPVSAHSEALSALADDAALLKYSGIGHLAGRVPADLSPGEKQRVALARALAGAPDVFLFDEPFSALDAETRDVLRDELKAFLRALAIPAIFVSHDRTDAQMLADKILVLREGAVMQSGPAGEVWQKPVSSVVARFIGVENVLAGRMLKWSGNDAWIELGKHMLQAIAPARPIQPGNSVVLSIRATDVEICSGESVNSPGINRFAGHITSLRSEGALIALTIDCGAPLKAYLLAPQARGMNLGQGSAMTVEIA
ncbi:MAG: ABC transporter ATP-binding protein, partial [Xanthobacteraceae bacterium]